MSAIDTAKEFVRLGSTVGLSKDVIDLLDKKASLLAEQVTALEQENTTLLRENRNLKLENENLKGQLQKARPKSNRLDETTEKILKMFFDSAQDISDRQIAQKFQLNLSVAGYHTDKLFEKTFITSNFVAMGGDPRYGITPEGRKYVVENGLAG
jgi:regulator of replication initiation timing